MMPKILYGLFATGLLLCLTGCGGDEGGVMVEDVDEARKYDTPADYEPPVDAPGN